MRLFWPAILCICFAHSVFSQTFHASPDPLLQKEVLFEHANECYIHFDNPGGDTLQLHWRLVQSNLPAAWDADMCDYGLCYIGIPSNGLMSPVFDTIRPYLKLIVQPGNAPGAAWIWFRVYEETNPANFVDVFYDLHTPGTLAAVHPETIQVGIYPNPAGEAFILQNNQSVPCAARIYNAAGQLFWQGDLPASGPIRMDSSQWPKGLYLVRTGNQTQKLLIH